MRPSAPPLEADFSERPRAAAPSSTADVSLTVDANPVGGADPQDSFARRALVNGLRVTSQAVTWAAGMAFLAEGAVTGFTLTDGAKTLSTLAEGFGGAVATAGLVGMVAGPIGCSVYVTIQDGYPPEPWKPAPRLGHAVKWAIAAVLSGVSSGVAVTYMEKYRQAEYARRDLHKNPSVALSGLSNPFPHQDTQKFLVVSPGLVTENGYAVTDYIRHGKEKDLNKVISIGNRALTRLAENPQIAPALPQPVSNIKIPITLTKSSSDVYQANGVLVGSKGVNVTCEYHVRGMTGESRSWEDDGAPLPPVQFRNNQKNPLLSLQKADWLSIERWKGGYCPSYTNVRPYENDRAEPGRAYPKVTLYESKPDVALEIALTPALLNNLKGKYFLSGYNASGGKVSPEVLQFQIINIMAAKALASKGVDGADPGSFKHYLDEAKSPGYDETPEGFYERFTDVAIQPPPGFNEGFYLKNGTSGESERALTSQLKLSIEKITTPTAWLAILDSSEKGRKANEKLEAAIPDMYVNQPVPTPDPSAN